METDLNFWLQLAVMLVCIGVGGRFGGVGLGAAGGLGVSILVLGFGLQPASPPVSTLLIIVAVIACTSILQGAGGLDLLVRLAEKMLRKWPGQAPSRLWDLLSARFLSCSAARPTWPSPSTRS